MNLDRYGSPVPRGGAQGAAAATVEPDTLSGFPFPFCWSADR